MTLDTQQDFEVLSEIYSKLYAKYKTNFGIPEILNILNENEDYKERMLSEIRQNSK
jgi:spore coat polysaccharide biosynthesis protein SpsF (cytidylyltransferase family)